MNYIAITLVCNLIVFLFEFYFDIRQSRMLSLQKTLPSKLQSYVDKEEFEDMQTYSILRLSFSRLESTYGFITEVGLLLAGIFIWTNSVAEDVVYFLFNWGPEYKVANGVVFLLLVSFYSAIMKAPFEIYRIVVIDSKFLQMDYTNALANWIWDQLKLSFMAIVVGIPLLSLILKLVSHFDPIHWLYVWAGSACCCVFVVELYPLIAPLFNNFNKLPEGKLRNDIMELASKLDIRVGDVYCVDASKRSQNANAYVYGFGKEKRIVLYDCLLEQLNDDEILAILAHEMGHYKKKHGTLSILLQIVTMGIYLFALSQTIYRTSFYKSFGFDEPNLGIGLCLFSYLYQPFGSAINVICNVVQRTFEYQCDRYSLELGYNIEQALILMHVNNVYNIIVDKHYSRYYNSHPSLMERLEKIEETRSKIEFIQQRIKQD